MSTKSELLTEQLFYKYITGVKGSPKIPTASDLTRLIEKVNTSDIEPILNIKMFDVLNYKKLYTAMSSIVDDFDLLYKAIDKQSENILEQLTDSLKEYRGVKRTLKRISNEADDINNGKTGIDNTRYVFTEKFNNTNNINTFTTTIDRDTEYPIIDVNAGQMYIPETQLNLMDLNHYYGKKMNIIPSNYNGSIMSSRFVGETDAAVILDMTNDNRLEYEIQLSDPSALKLSFILQLKANGGLANINGIALSLDSNKTHGLVRVEYKTNSGWQPVPGIETQVITDDSIPFAFDYPIDTDYLKFSFLKEMPDNMTELLYYLSINDISIFKAKNNKTSTLISKSIEIKPFSVENPVIGTIISELKGSIPQDCYADVYVAKDKLIPAYYVNKDGEYVNPESNNKFELIIANDTTPKERYLLLSDIAGRPSISGVTAFEDLQFDWQLLKSFTNDDLKPEVINFNNINKKDPYDNSIANESKLLFGDPYYNIADGVSGLYPQADYPTTLSDWFASGVFNSSNEHWDPYMSGLVETDGLLDGADYGTNISGYPFNWYNVARLRQIRFNEYINFIPGWYRPDSDIVTPSGITDEDGNIDEVTINSITQAYPDFYINGMKFFKIYKFEKNSEVLSSDVNLYMYQTKPVNGEDNINNTTNDYYPHNMIWNYNDRRTEKTHTYLGKATENGSGIISIPLPSGTEYINNSVTNVRYYDENLVLDHGRQYLVNDIESGILTIDFSPSADDTTFISNRKISLNYSYNEIDKYSSYWKGYIIVDDDNSKITINQYTIDARKEYTGIDELILNNNPKNKIPIVNKYKIINIETDEVITQNDSNENKNYNFLKEEQQKEITLNRGIYEFVVHCLTDENGSYPAKWWSPNSSKFMNVIGNARLVPDINPLRVVSLETLLYSTQYENDTRCSVITDVDDFQYVVVKEPSKNMVPGYYFHNTNNAYIKNPEHLIKNIGHYKRRHLTQDGTSTVVNDFITGSQKVSDAYIVVSGDYITNDGYVQDYRWNKGNIYPQDFSNTNDSLYPQHSTFGTVVNIDDDIATSSNNTGYLFYNTAENLPSFYTIQYGVVDRNDASLNKFLYKIELTSESENQSPVIDSVKFTINANLDEL